MDKTLPRTPLPSTPRFFLTDAGLETDILFNKGIELPHFASVTLLGTDEGRRALETYFREFLELASGLGCGFVLESATWRASPDWALPLGYSQAELDELNRSAIGLLLRLRTEYAGRAPSILVSGCIGPRGDGYDPGRIMSVDEARAYHSHQAEVLFAAGADLLSGITMTNIPEALGLVEAARRLGAPVVISFTVETDGRLPTGDSLASAIQALDEATDGYPAYYMVNCAHPSHFRHVLDEEADWVGRICGLRANASRCSHAELEVMTELDAGNPSELGEAYRELTQSFPNLRVLGGCCGTDLRHVKAMADACL